MSKEIKIIILGKKSVFITPCERILLKGSDLD